jgi:hypothetical protein
LGVISFDDPRTKSQENRIVQQKSENFSNFVLVFLRDLRFGAGDENQETFSTKSQDFRAETKARALVVDSGKAPQEGSPFLHE